ncbi:MAG TPA: VWA domain-containing protein [Thermoanaerobaculia bacterium]|nr:VWA domain-containing protein [Thermoanaerobaculia bacterium]
MLAVALTFAFAATILGDVTDPEVVRKLSKRERRSRIEKLEPRHQEFANDVEPIILPAELDMFLSLERETDRDSFVDEFWRRRDHAARAHGQFRETYYRRLAIAKEEFTSTASDRAKLFLLHGPPEVVLKPRCERLLQPTEIWKYPTLGGVGNDLRLLFYKPRHQGDFRLWNPTGGAVALSDLLLTGDSVTQRTPGERQRENLGRSQSPYAYINRIQLECGADGNELMMAITQMVQARVDLLKLFSPPELNNEQVAKMMKSVVIANPNAPKMTADFSVRYPGKDGSRTDVQMLLEVPRSQLSPAEVAGTEVYTIDVTGEVLRDGKLWEKYRYRFDFPGDTQAEKLPIVIDRFLRPAEYVSRVKITDAHTGAEAVVERTLEVPEVFVAEAVPEIVKAAEAAAPDSGSVAGPGEKEPEQKPALRLIPPTSEIVSGMQTIEAMLSGDAIKAVEFWLDGKKLAVRRSTPFALDFDFGAVPTMRRVRALGLDAKGQAITGDELVLNTGTDPFRVRIVSPRVAPLLVGPSRIEMDVSVPEGDELASLELYWNERRMATLFDPPFVQTIDIPKTEGAGYLRAVARLKDETAPPVEDVVMINTPAYMEELNVHLIELPTTVLIGGRPSENLTEKAFKVLDEGQPVNIAKFEHVKNLPLSIGVVLDTSGSMMGQRLEEAQKAGAEFFQEVMRKGDKAFVVAFDREPRLMQKWSPKISDMHAALARLRAEDYTALYDAIIYSLYNFHGVRGQKALIVISDGRDTASKFTYDQALEYARRSAVPIYAVGIGIRSGDNDVRFKLDKLTRETGGATFYIEQARELQKVYDDIQAELRSQYILGFYPSPDVKPGSKWRELTVQVTEGKVKTIKGYFP